MLYGWVLNATEEKDCPGFTMANKEEKWSINVEECGSGRIKRS